MNPVTVEFLSQVEKQKHAREIRAIQLLNQVDEDKPRQVPVHRRMSRWMAHRLAQVLIVAGHRLQTWSVAADP
jgi:hypothetical protein